MGKKHSDQAAEIEPEVLEPQENPASETEIVAESEIPAQESSCDSGAELAALQDKYLRVQAEYQNYRKRMARDIADARRVGVVDTLEVFLPLFDQFAMAVQAVEKSDNVAAIKQGLRMISDAYAKSLEELGVHSFDAVGNPFDPARHDAVAQEPSDTVPEGVVSRQWSVGYTMGDRVLRPARVVVSSGPAKAEEEN